MLKDSINFLSLIIISRHMKRLLLGISLFATWPALAQTKQDTIRLLQQTAGLFNLTFSEAESDSMITSIQDYANTYKDMHRTMPPNDLAYPFAYNPAPIGFTIPTKQQKIVWDIPANVSLPKNRAELAFYSIPQLASLIKNKKISSVELTQFFIDRLKKWDDSVKVVITLTEDLALQEAKQADADLKKGIYRGPLHGIPYGLKDLFAVKGYKTTWGTTPYKDQVIDENAYVYEQLKKAGAVLCAKLSLGALAYNDLWFGGRTNNPWNLRQGSSGSSAGSAAATVAGLLPFTIGTETLGSIISPSTRTGATGLRHTFGTVSRSGAMVLCWSLDKIGPICRSAEDCAIVYAAINGTDGEDPSGVNHAFNYSSKKDIKKMRIAYAENYFKRLNKDAMEWKALEDFKALGATIVPVTFPDSGVYNNNLIGIILTAESAAAFDELTRSNRDDLIERQDKDFWPNTWRAARYIPAVEYINANRYRSTLNQKVQEFMKNYDVVIVPTFAGSQLSITNLTGNPAVCFPIGFTKAGNPYSITLLGNLYDEASILEVAKAYQDRTEHNKKHPELFKQ
jgi:Asp-tRNA(Asn)/Glu-tRNA(Gln) amidotransferase A subunit family amidase